MSVCRSAKPDSYDRKQHNYLPRGPLQEARQGAIKVHMIEGVMSMEDRSHDDAMAALFRDDSAAAAAVLDAILVDGNRDELRVMLRKMAKAFGDIPGTATSTLG